jgi:NADH-quinone oxidoreductase subunit E
MTGRERVLPRIADQDVVDGIIAAHAGRPGALLGILERLQEHEPGSFLPLPLLEYVAARTRIPQAQVFAVATFFALFNLEPQGDHTVAICRGTACHTRGSRPLLEQVKLRLGLRDDGDEPESLSRTTPDRHFTVRTVACFGQCALAPVVEIDHAIRGHVTEQALMREIGALGSGRSR